MKTKTLIFAAIICSVLCAAAAFSQNVSAVLSGTVKDPAGAVIPNAQVTLTNQATRAVETSATNEAGIFIFPSVLPGTYSLNISTPGFRSLNMKDIGIATNERRALGDLILQVGEIAQSVEITAEATPVQTASSERAGLVSGDQILNIATKGRDFIGLLSMLPGIVDTNLGSREVTMTGNVLNGLHINGGRTNSIMYALDGISSVDTGSNSSVQNQPNMDAISEVSVLASNYQAEYGRNSAGTINVVIKGGTTAFHGSAYWYYRDRSLNANNFFSNRTGTERPAYHFNNVGYSIGGPVYIPGKFNTSKDKLFFFFSQEFVRRRLYPGTRWATTPTALEREGDFSKSLDVGGKVIPVKDPLTGKPFDGNKVPASRINSLGQQILKFFPLPNWVETDPGQINKRNYRTDISGNNPRRQEVVRVDYNVTPTLRMYFRGIRDNDDEEWPYGSWVAGDVNYDLTNTLRPQRGRGAVLNVTKILSPKTVNEFTFGATTRGQTFNPVEPEKLARSRMGNIGQWFPASNESHAIPSVTFGGNVQNSINPNPGNIPYTNENPVFAWTDNFSILVGKHAMKFGAYIERMRKDEVGGPNTRGSFAFARDTNNPFDTGYSFSNALLGYFQSYSEGTFRPYSHYRYTQMEWYAQDSWKVSRKLTLDYGLRFYHTPGAHDDRFNITTFDPSSYDRSKTALLIRPGKDSSGKRVGVDPRTGTVYPATYIGLFAPGSGTYSPGMVVGGKNFVGSLYETPAVSFGPRVGFAYDPFGNGKTAIRGGVGIFYDRPQGNVYSATNGQPPVAYTPTLYYGSLDTFLQSQGAVGPSGVDVVQVGEQQLPRVANFSLGVQRDIGFSTVVDVSYVGSLGRHLLYVRNMNAIPMYAKFDPANADPTTGRPLPDNFLRPYVGLGNVNVRSFGGTSSYNSLQLTVNRRMTRGLQFGAAYTFSKGLGLADADFDSQSIYFSLRDRDYGLLGYDRPHALVINYTYQLPDLGKRLGVKPLEAILGNWQISGITTFASGTPLTASFGTTDGADITGSAEGARIDMVGDPYLPKSERTFGRNFNTAAFARPAARTFGNSGIGYLRGPGTNNWDVTISKRIPLGNTETRYIQFRTELYNAFNHTQFSGMDTSASFDATGKQVDANFGAFTGARDPRRIQLSLRLMF